MADKALTLKEELEKEGYSKEEAYFYKLNRGLIERRRHELDTKRAEQKKREELKVHWMRCPKCGAKLHESSLLGIMVDQCESCYGVFMDQGEIETLIKTEESKTFLNKLKKLFHPPEGIPELF